MRGLCDQEERIRKGAVQEESITISIVIPALNEENGIVKTISAIPKGELKEMGYETQILVVDNGSQDCTAKLAKEAGAEVILEPRRGYGRAYKTGFAHMSGQIVVTADADCSYPLEDIPMLVTILEEEDLDFITTDRFSQLHNGAMSFQHRLGNGVLSFLARLLFQTNIKDSQSGMWVIRKELLDQMLLTSDSMSFSQEVKIEACSFLKCNWREIPITYVNRVGDVKLRTWRDGIGNMLGLIIKRIQSNGYRKSLYIKSNST